MADQLFELSPEGIISDELVCAEMPNPVELDRWEDSEQGSYLGCLNFCGLAVRG